MAGLYWIRSDLRIHDNEALNAFYKKHGTQGLVVWAPTESYFRAGSFRQKWIDESVEEFAETLMANQIRVLVLKSKIEDEIEALVEKFSIQQIYLTQEYAFEERQTEILVQKICDRKEVQLENFDQSTLVTQANLPFAVPDMPFVFTDFRKKVEAQLKVNSVVDTELPLSPPNRAQHRLFDYIWQTHAIQSYKETRNGLLVWNDSSKLSPFLSLGLISARQIYREIKKYESQVLSNDSTYWMIFELLWRDYFKFFSLKHDSKIFQEHGVRKNQQYSPTPDEDLFQKWCLGETEDPFINANMRELLKTGWMSNRGRQNVASYLVHNLYLPWTWGAQYFEKMLIDYDPDLNWGNWLYLSGNGSDPRARQFNPIRQAEMYDPRGEYQKKWLST